MRTGFRALVVLILVVLVLRDITTQVAAHTMFAISTDEILSAQDNLATAESQGGVALTQEDEFVAAAIDMYLPWKSGQRWLVTCGNFQCEHATFYPELNGYAFDAQPLGADPTVVAIAGGTVISVVNDVQFSDDPDVKAANSAGNCVAIDHGGGVYSGYAHMETGSVPVAVGSRVERGQTIGRAGRTGYVFARSPLLHWGTSSTRPDSRCENGISSPSTYKDVPGNGIPNGEPDTYYTSGNSADLTTPGTQNPSFSGGKLPTIANATSTHNDTAAKLVLDGKTWTNWHSGHVTPTSARLTLDLGTAKSISGVKWKFSALGFSDSFVVRLVSYDGTVLKGYGPFGNGTSTQNWYGIPITDMINATSIRFDFTNPNQDTAVGAIGEVEVWHGFSSVEQNPHFAGRKVIIANSASTPNTGTSFNAHDGNDWTNWAAHGTPSTGSLRFDLGDDYYISGVKWKMPYLGYADNFTVRLISSTNYYDGEYYDPIQDFGPFTNPTQAQVFFGVRVPSNAPSLIARYIEFHFTNPNNDSAIGSISEVEIWQPIYEVQLPGTQDPVFEGSQIGIVGSDSTPNTVPSTNAHDGNVWTNWHSGHVTPASASLRLDLGQTANVSGVKWTFSSREFADKFYVRLLNSSGQVTQTLGPFGTGYYPPPTYYGQAVANSNATRYVQFFFENPYADSAVGSLGEVQVFGTYVANPPGTTNPTFTGSKATVSNVFDSLNTGTASRVLDGVSWSNFATSATTPSTVTLTLDLGTPTPLSGVRWMWSSLGYADQVDVRLSTVYGGATTSLGTFGNGTATGTWYGASTTTSARFVQFVFTNPNRDAALGALGEVEIWKQGATVNPPGTANPSVAGLTKRPFTNIFADPASASARNAADGVTWSNWASPATRPASASLTTDLGSVQPVRAIRWQMPNLGYADQFTVRIATSYGSWTTVGTFGNPGATYSWYGLTLPSGTEARFVQLLFANPNGDAALGSIGEIEAWVGSTMFSAAGDPDLPGDVLPISCEADVPAADEHGADNACDMDGGTWWETAATSPDEVALTATLDQPATITGIKWNAHAIDGASFTITIAGETYGPFQTTVPGAYTGLALPEPVEATSVTLTFTNLTDAPSLGNLAELEVWGLLEEVATPQASPDAGTPAASPEAIETEPAATPGASPAPEETDADASPAPVETEIEASPAPVETEIVEDEQEPTENPATPQPVTEEPTATIIPTEEPTEIPATPMATVEPTEAEQPTTEPTVDPTVEPTAAVATGTITGTDGDLINCRITPVDGDPITQLAEGDTVTILGVAQDGWIPVNCAGQVGWVAEQFLTIGDVAPTEPVEPTPIETTEGTESVEATEPVTPETEVAVTEEPTPEPTEVMIQPYNIVDAGDTENSGTAWNVLDGDPSTAWLVSPSQSPKQSRLYLDLGQVLPIDRITLEMAWSDNLPHFEIWLSEDAETWYNATPNGINGWNLWADEAHVFSLGYDARYIRIVIPNVDESGLSEVGGIGEIEAWPGEITQTSYLTSLGSPTTPTPEPVIEEPTAEPTEEVVKEPTEDVIEDEPLEDEPAEVFPTEDPTVEPVVTDPVATEVPVPDEDDGEAVG